MQLLAFGGCTDAAPLVGALGSAGLRGVLYEDVNDPRGVALLTFSTDPAVFVGPLRRSAERAAVRVARPEARVHDAGPDLRHRLRARSRRNARGPADADGAQPRLAVGDLVSACAAAAGSRSCLNRNSG